MVESSDGLAHLVSVLHTQRDPGNEMRLWIMLQQLFLRLVIRLLGADRGVFKSGPTSAWDQFDPTEQGKC